MFRLYRNYEFHRVCSPSDYDLVLSPREALEQAKKHYDLNPQHYSYYGPFQTPNLLRGAQPWTPVQRGYSDPVYSTIKHELEVGWLIGIDLMERWSSFRNPFYINDDGQLVCENSTHYHSWFIREVMNGYQDAVANRNGKKPPPTQRFRYNYSEPVQHAQATKTLNSKAVGRLLAAGGIYNGNIEGFHQTALQLGGDAPAGYDQVMDNKGLLIAGASVVTGLTMGRMKVPTLEELQALEHYGAKGTYSGRDFDPDLAGGPILNLSTEGVVIDKAGIATVEKHVARFEEDYGNIAMVDRLKRIERGELKAEQVDLNYYTHECREFERYCNLGWESGQPPGVEGYNLWNHAHTATLEDYKLKGKLEDLYHPDALK